MRRWRSSGLILALALALLSPVLAAPASGVVVPEPLFVDNPFPDVATIDRLRAKLPPNSLPQEYDSYLVKLTQIQYAFALRPECPYSTLCGPNPDLEKPYYLATRRLRFDASGIDAAVARGLSRHEDHGCSSLRFPNLRRTVVTQQYLQFDADITATKRACGSYPWPFTGEWKTDLGTASGTVVARVTLSTEAPDFIDLAKKGRFDLSASADAHVDNKQLLGFINANSLVGKIIAAMAEVQSPIISMATFGKTDLGFRDMADFINRNSISFGQIYDAAHDNAVLNVIPQFYENVNQSLKTPYFLSVDDTGFVADGSRQFSVSQLTLLNDVQFRAFYYPAKKHEIDLIKSLRESDGTAIAVAGDSWWKLAERKYGSGSFAYLLARANGGGRIVNVGQTVLLPPLYKFLEYNDSVVRPGDTLWSRYTAKYGTKAWNLKNLRPPLGSFTKAKIYPMQVLEF